MGRKPTRTKILPVVVSNKRLAKLIKQLGVTIGERFKMPVEVVIYERALTQKILDKHKSVFYCRMSDTNYSFEQLCTEFGFSYIRQRIKGFDALSSLSVVPCKGADFALLAELPKAVRYEGASVTTLREKSAFSHLFKQTKRDIENSQRRIIYLTGMPRDELSGRLERLFGRAVATMHRSTLERADMSTFFGSRIRFETIDAILAELPKAKYAEYALYTLLGRGCARSFYCSSDSGFSMYGPDTVRHRDRPYLASENPIDLLLALSDWIRCEWQMPGAADWVLKALTKTLDEGYRAPAIYEGGKLVNFETFWQRVVDHLGEPIRVRERRAERKPQ